MSGISISSLTAIVNAGNYFDINVDLTNPVKMKSTLENILQDPNRATELYRTLLLFTSAVIELKRAEVGLGSTKNK